MKSSEHKKPAWNRARVYKGAAGRSYQVLNIMPEIYENECKSIQIHNNLRDSLKPIEDPSRTMEIYEIR